MKVKFWGVRGSIPTPGQSTINFGGNTSCVSIQSNKYNDKFIILDGGSGLREFGNEIMRTVQFENGVPNKLDFYMFFTHVHWDHIQGIPFFKPMFIRGNNIHMYGEKKVRTNLEDTLKGQQQYPNFPISVEEIEINGSRITFRDLHAGEIISCILDEGFNQFTISCTKLSHPDGVFCYRIDERENGSIVYATDTEHRAVIDPRLLKIAKDATVLIYDAQYTPEEYSGKVGIPRFDWGHSTYEVAVETAIAANVQTLILFHHDPEHDDKMILDIEKRAQRLGIQYGSTIQIRAAYEGMEIDL